MLIVADSSNLIYLFCPQELPAISKTIFENIVLFFCASRHSSIFYRQMVCYPVKKNLTAFLAVLTTFNLNCRTGCQRSAEWECCINVYYLLRHHSLLSVFGQIRLGQCLVKCRHRSGADSPWLSLSLYWGIDEFFMVQARSRYGGHTLNCDFKAVLREILFGTIWDWVTKWIELFLMWLLIDLGLNKRCGWCLRFEVFTEVIN
jgi:hypothetical protein